MVPEAQDAIPLGLKKPGAGGIAFSGLIMLTPIHFDDKPGTVRGKVSEIRA